MLTREEYRAELIKKVEKLKQAILKADSIDDLELLDDLTDWVGVEDFVDRYGL